QQFAGHQTQTRRRAGDENACHVIKPQAPLQRIRVGSWMVCKPKWTWPPPSKICRSPRLAFSHKASVFSPGVFHRPLVSVRRGVAPSFPSPAKEGGERRKAQ